MLAEESTIRSSRSGQASDDLDQLVGPVALTPGEVHQFPSLDDEGVVLRRAGDGDPPAPAELEETFVPEETERTEHRVGVDAQHRRQVPGRGQALAGAGLPVGDGPSDRGGDLFVKGQRVGAIDLDVDHGATHTSTMSTEAPSRPEDSAVEQATEVLIREARRRQRRRRLFVAGAVVVLVLAGRAILAGTAGGPPPPAHHHGLHPGVHPQPTPPLSVTHVHAQQAGPVRPQPTAPVPVTTAQFAEFSGKWALANDVVTIEGSGQGSVDWRTLTWCPAGTTSPYDGEPCDTLGPDGVVTSGGHADLQLTAASGTTATAVVSGSTEPSALPDGPARLRVTGQDVLYVTPSGPTTQSPFGRSALCGPTALALSLTQQEAAGIQCGA